MISKQIMVIILLGVLTAVGCASFERNAYRVVGTTTTLVDAAMNAWGDYVRSDAATAEQEAKVKATYMKYQLTGATAKAVIDSYRKNLLTENEVNAALKAASENAAALIDLIVSFLPADKGKTIVRMKQG